MTSWDEIVELTRSTFIERMRRRGFDYDEAETKVVGATTLSGSIVLPDGHSIDVEIRLVGDWPYRHPKVIPSRGSTAMSWHQEPDGSLCLFPPAGSAMPWLDADLLIERIRDWFINDAAGWPDDEPDLDLERYFPPQDGPLVVYEELRALVGKQVKVAREGHVEAVRHSGKRPDKLRRRHGRVVDLGELERPVRSWDDVATRLGDDAELVERSIHAADGGHLLALYRRGEHQAAICWQAAVEGEDIVLRARESADRSATTLQLRAGPDASALADRSAAVVGVGAVGSYAADLLARAGLQRLVLCDSETLRPGNCIRHLAGQEHVGKAKTEAVRDVIRAAGHEPPGDIELRGAVRTRSEAADLMRQVHVVVECTGAAPTTALLSDAAEHSTIPAVSAYLQRDGGIIRIDRWPLTDAESRLPEVPRPPDPPGQPLREGGCGDPVSPAPASAAAAAAASVSRAAVRLLTDRAVPPSTIEILTAQPDPPYETRGVVT